MQLEWLTKYTDKGQLLERVSKQKEYMEKYAGKSGRLGMVSSSIMSDDGDDDTKREEDGAKVLEARGCVGVVKVLSEETCRELLEHINSAIAKDSEDRTNPNFGNVYSRKNRFDYKLDLKQPTVRKAVKEASANLRQILAKTCGNRKIGGTSSDENQIELLELAALVSDPQSSRQPVHPDTNYRQNLCAVTTFIALQDVSEALRDNEDIVLKALDNPPFGGTSSVLSFASVRNWSYIRSISFKNN